MQVSIIPNDFVVYKDGVGMKIPTMDGVPPNVHALQFNTDTGSGWIEYIKNPLDVELAPNTDILELPDWATLALDAWEVANNKWHADIANAARLVAEREAAENAPPTAAKNKEKATALLLETDWTQIPSIVDPAQSTPYLANKDAFTTYRNAVREIAINPVAGDIDWPTKPSAIWV